MPAIIIYLLKVNLALVLFYLAYYVGLRKLTFYQLNRYFLLFGIFFSSLYPLIDLSQLFSQHIEQAMGGPLLIILPDWNTVSVESASQIRAINHWQLWLLVFWGGMALMSLRFIMQLISLYRIHRESRPARLNGYTYRQLNSSINPFSFWQTIYLNPLQHSAEELEAIFRHEQIHVKEWHTMDVLLARLNTLFYWFNPGAWLIQQAVVENLEFITDRKMLQSGIDHKSYQYNLLRMSSGIQPPVLVNNFSIRTLKKRINMMNRKQSSHFQISRYLLLPLLVALMFGFSISNAQNNSIIKLDEGQQSGKTVSINDSVLYYLDAEEVSAGVLKTIDPKDIDHMHILKGENATTVLGEKASGGAVVITTKENKDAPEVKAFNEKIEKRTPTSSSDRKFRIMLGSEFEGAGLEDALILLNGEKVSQNVVENLNANRIEKVEVLKGEEAIEKYGEEGRNGVIIITTK